MLARTSVVAALVLAVATAVSAASSTVTISSSAGSGALGLDGEGSFSTHVVKIADVTLWTDASAGLSIFITSASLTKASGSTPIAFQVLLVNSGAAAPAASAFTTPSGTEYSWSSTGAGSFDKDLYIKYTPTRFQDPGVYAANVDLDVRDN